MIGCVYRQGRQEGRDGQQKARGRQKGAREQQAKHSMIPPGPFRHLPLCLIAPNQTLLPPATFLTASFSSSLVMQASVHPLPFCGVVVMLPRQYRRRELILVVPVIRQMTSTVLILPRSRPSASTRAALRHKQPAAHRRAVPELRAVAPAIRKVRPIHTHVPACHLTKLDLVARVLPCRRTPLAPAFDRVPAPAVGARLNAHLTHAVYAPALPRLHHHAAQLNRRTRIHLHPRLARQLAPRSRPSGGRVEARVDHALLRIPIVKVLDRRVLACALRGFTSTKGVVVVTALFFPAALLYPFGHLYLKAKRLELLLQVGDNSATLL